MNIKFRSSTKNKIFSSLLNILTIPCLICFTPLKSENLKSLSNLTPEYFSKKVDNDYILDTGDIIKVSISPFLTEFDGTHKISENGTISLPRLKTIYIANLTVTELAQLLDKSYKNFVKEPDTKITIVRHRPIRIYLKGEIRKPGLYTLPGEFQLKINSGEEELLMSPSDFIVNKDLDLEEKVIVDNNTSYFPSLFDVIQSVGGITLSSDLSNIEITRKNSSSNGGGYKKANLNFLSFFVNDDFSQNIRIYDGDIINIPKASNDLKKQLNLALKSNINPNSIKVFIGGRVEKPGSYSISSSATLNDLIALAGGKEIFSGKVKLIRYDLNDNPKENKIKYNRNGKKGSSSNPYLQSGDIVSIDKSVLNTASDVVSFIFDPLSKVATTIITYEALKD